MPQIQKVFLGAVAIVATLGAVQLASGHDLVDRWQAVADMPSLSASDSPKIAPSVPCFSLRSWVTLMSPRVAMTGIPSSLEKQSKNAHRSRERKGGSTPSSASAGGK